MSPRANFVAPLGEALAFSAEDLEKNRDGELSQAQLEKLTKDVRFNVGCMGPIAFGLFGLCLAVGVSAVILITSQVTSLRWFSLLAPAALTGVTSVVVFFYARGARRLWRDVRRPGTVRMEAALAKRMDQVGGREDASTRYFANVGDLALPTLTKPAWHALDEGRIYRVFLTFHARRFLSLEPVDAAEREAEPTREAKPAKKKKSKGRPIRG